MKAKRREAPTNVFVDQRRQGTSRGDARLCNDRTLDVASRQRLVALTFGLCREVSSRLFQVKMPLDFGISPDGGNLSCGNPRFGRRLGLFSGWAARCYGCFCGPLLGGRAAPLELVGDDSTVLAVLHGGVTMTLQDGHGWVLSGLSVC
jgi:hypothetical protein